MGGYPVIVPSFHCVLARGYRRRADGNHVLALILTAYN
jgi:hypothetical protein